MGSGCRLCNNEEFSTEYTIGEYSVLKCTHCGFVYTSPLPDDDSIYHLYKSRYFDSAKDLGYPDYQENQAIRRKTFEYYFSIIRQYIKNKNEALDIGCADGSFLDVLKENGFRNVEEVELNEEMFNETSERYTLYKEPIERSDIGKKYDLVTMFDVLEHVPDLNAALTRIHGLLSAQGLLVILTPDYGSRQRKVKGKNWFQFKPREHINYFTKARLERLLGDHGFEMVYYEKGVSLVDKKFLQDRLKRYGYSLLSLLFAMAGGLLFLRSQYIRVDNSSIFMIAKSKHAE